MYNKIIKKKFNLLIILLFSWLIAIPNVVTANNVYGPTKKGDIFWNIAAKARPNSSISRYQVMIALLKANPHAFQVPCNLNTLKSGQMLHIPLPISMQALSRTEAVKEFKRQQKAWKNHRNQKQTIICQQHSTLPTINQSVTQAAVINPVTITPVIDSSLTFSPINENQSPPIAQQKTIPSLTSSIWNDGLAWFSTNMSLPPMVGFLMVIILLLLLSISKNSRKYGTNTVTKKPSVQLKTISQLDEHHATVNSNDSSLTPDPINANLTGADSKKSLYTEMEDKLDNVKDHLAGDEAQTTQRILREVIQKGTSEQKDEAKQLLKINKKMDFLKHLNGEKKPYPVFSKVANNPVWEKNEHSQPQQQYLPENQEKIFGLVDNFFELLDYELNGQGELFDAYLKRQQSSKNYEILNKSEEKLVNDEGNLANTIRPEPKPTRFL